MNIDINQLLYVIFEDMDRKFGREYCVCVCVCVCVLVCLHACFCQRELKCEKWNETLRQAHMKYRR